MEFGVAHFPRKAEEMHDAGEKRDGSTHLLSSFQLDPFVALPKLERSKQVAMLTF